jgi:diacylglycerol kinase family enzyme
VSVASLRHSIEQAGHDVVRVIDHRSEFAHVLEEPTELAVVAGGDGTVWRAIVAVAGRGLPLAILPVGTANNIARSMGIHGSIPELIERWKGGRYVPFDVGTVRGGWGESRFVEAVGGGLISAGIAAMTGAPPRDKGQDIVDKLTRAVRKYRDVLSRLLPRRLTLTLDGERVQGEFIVVEVLNIRSVGPNIVLSPEADSSDGVFTVVTAEDKHRAAIDDYLRLRLEGQEPRLSLPTRRASQVEIEGWDEIHVDDRVRSGASVGTVSMRIEAAAAHVLA